MNSFNYFDEHRFAKKDYFCATLKKNRDFHSKTSQFRSGNQINIH